MRRWMRTERARNHLGTGRAAQHGAFTYAMPRLSQIAHARGLSVAPR